MRLLRRVAPPKKMDGYLGVNGRRLPQSPSAPPKKMDGYLGANGRRLPQSLRSFAMTYSGRFLLHAS